MIQHLQSTYYDSIMQACSFLIFTRGQFWPSGIVIDVRPSVRPSVRLSVCALNNSSLVHRRLMKRTGILLYIKTLDEFKNGAVWTILSASNVTLFFGNFYMLTM